MLDKYWFPIFEFIFDIYGSALLGVRIYKMCWNSKQMVVHFAEAY